MSRLSVVTAVICLLPLVGIVSGDASSAFSMYATLIELRLELVGRDANGMKFQIAPTAVAPFAPRSARAVLSGADHFRRNFGRTAMHARLADVARLACNVSSAVEIEATLTERWPHSGRSEQKTERVTCARP